LRIGLKNDYSKQKEMKWMDVAKTEGEKFYKGNKLAGIRARKALDQIAKLKVQWRKETSKP
jgi:hypothetical protein